MFTTFDKDMKNLIISFLLMLFGIMSAQAEKIVVAYLTSGSNEMPTEEYVTHINYAFGQVNTTFDGITVDRPENLKKITSQKGELKVLLSIGGWTSGGFSEMAASTEQRLSFAKDCKRIVDEFNLDGIEKAVEELQGKNVYLTIDMDVMDPSIFPGTGTPEAGGVQFIELLEAVLKLKGLNIVGADINELSPQYDTSGVSTAVACKLLRELLLMLED